MLSAICPSRNLLSDGERTHMFNSYYPSFLQQPQSFQPAIPSLPQAPSLSGRIVKSVEEIVPNEVPMNGSVALFPTSDMSAIFVKGWNQDGTISTVVFRPVSTEDVQEQPSVTLADVMNSLDDIQDMLKASKPKTTRKTTKKEDSDDGE